ncbi:uncharacterized protein LOC141633737 [Silene latifolia]|uniref:uncharacterized protein LOC141633737 n=1 Tax=Silene latifolia TaxID=37657 RepID=UPI003D77BFD8
MHNTRRSKGPVTFDLEIERTARRLRKEFLERKAEEALHLDKFFCEEENQMAEKTLKQLQTPDVTTAPLRLYVVMYTPNVTSYAAKNSWLKLFYKRSEVMMLEEVLLKEP